MARFELVRRSGSGPNVYVNLETVTHIEAYYAEQGTLTSVKVCFVGGSDVVLYGQDASEFVEQIDPSGEVEASVV